MKESKFIEQNKEKWEKLERMLNAQNNDPNALSDLFIQLTDDLSYSRTFYPNRTVRAYLNNLTRKIFEKIYINKRAKKDNVLYFWKKELPAIMFQSRRELLISFIVFVVAMAIGVFSSVVDDDFSKMILGQQYVDMTVENIESGDPMAVYKTMNQVDMFLGITWNNVLVAFRTFVFGILLGLGSLFILIYNGIMVGTFQYFFIERGLFMESFLTIWIHGTLEISSVVIAGAAGLVFGKGLLFPGTMTRLQSFQESAVRALKIFIGVVPIFILAGLLESFVTRYTDVPDILRAAIILLSGGFIVYYFVILPFRTGRRAPKPEPLGKSSERKYSGEAMLQGEITNISEIFNFSFGLYQSRMKNFLPLVIALSLINVPLFVFLIYPDTLEFFYLNSLSDQLSRLFDYQAYPPLLLSNSVAMAVILFLFSRMVAEHQKPFFSFSAADAMMLVKFLVVTLILNSLFLIGAQLWALLLLFVALPYGLHGLMTLYRSEKSLFRAFGYSFELLQGSGGRLWGVYFSMFILVFIVYLFFSSPLFVSSTHILEWSLPYSEENITFVVYTFKFWFMTFLVYMSLPVIYVPIAMNYYSHEEIVFARGLKKKIANFIKK